MLTRTDLLYPEVIWGPAVSHNCSPPLAALLGLTSAPIRSRVKIRVGLTQRWLDLGTTTREHPAEH